MSEAMECMNLTKVYRGSVYRALSDVSLKMHRSGIFTLLGRNGAGKTTLLRIATTQLLPTSGSVRVLGHDVVKEAKQIRRSIAVLPQEARTFPPLTPWDHVYFTLLARGVSRLEARIRAKQALEELELLQYISQPADRLSGGLRQRILVAMAIATEAELLFLDEPTLGLDVINRRKVWSVARDYCKSLGSILLTTHSLDEAESLSDYVVILDEGRIVSQGTVESLKSSMTYRVRVEFSSGFSEEELESYGKVVNVAGRVRVFTDEDGAKELTSAAVGKRVSVTVSPITLEDVFVDLVEEGE